jgi:SAM-dependent methyltransferase
VAHAPVIAPAPQPTPAAPSVHAAVTPIAAAVAPSPARLAPAAAQAPIDIKDLPPMRALAPTEPEALEVQFEDEPMTPRPSEPDTEIAPEDMVSVESAPSPSKGVSPPQPPVQVQSTQPVPVRTFTAGAPLPLPGTSAAAAAAANAASARPGGSLPPPPKGGGGAQGKARMIVPTAVASPLAPPPMSDTQPIGRRKARPWWEELFNDDFIRTMAKISDEQIAKEVDFIEESLAVAKGAMLLDLACGTGRHAIELTRRGYKVVGFDLSLPMLARAAEEAQERNQKLNFVQGDMREMTFEDTFDGIYCWATSFGFFEEDKNASVVQRVHKALKKGGQFLLDVVNRDYIIRQAPSLAWFEGDGCICMDEMSIDWITSRMKVKRTMMMDDGRTKEIDYSVRVYSLHELGKVLHESGFRVAEVSGRTATPGVFFGAESPRTMILAEKK